MATAKKTPTRKPAARKPAAKKTTTKKAATAKPSREDVLVEKAIKLVDEAAEALRSGIKTGGETASKVNVQSKKKAHKLLTQAQTSLVDALSETTSALHKAINKLP